MVAITIGGTTKRSKFAPRVISFDGATWVDFLASLPDVSQEFIVRYGIKQYLGDGAAGADTQDDFETGVDERTRKVLEADFARTSGEKAPVNNVETLANKLARDAVKTAVKGMGLSKEAIDDLVAELMEADEGDEYRAEAQATIDARENMADKIRAMLNKDESADETQEDA